MYINSIEKWEKLYVFIQFTTRQLELNNGLLQMR